MNSYQSTQYKWEYKLSNYDVVNCFVMHLGGSPRKTEKTMVPKEENEMHNMVY